MIFYFYANDTRFLVNITHDVALHCLEDIRLLLREVEDGNLLFAIVAVFMSRFEKFMDGTFYLVPPCLFLIVAQIGVVIGVDITFLAFDIDCHQFCDEVIGADDVWVDF